MTTTTDMTARTSNMTATTTALVSKAPQANPGFDPSSHIKAKLDKIGTRAAAQVDYYNRIQAMGS